MHYYYKFLSLSPIHDVNEPLYFNNQYFNVSIRFANLYFYVRPYLPSKKESDGKWAGYSNKKIGNHHLKWAIKEAVILMLRESDQAKEYVAKLERKYNKGKALGLFAHKLGRTIYFMLKNKEVFQMQKFLSQ